MNEPLTAIGAELLRNLPGDEEFVLAGRPLQPGATLSETSRFAGQRPGQHISADRLGQRLIALGVQLSTARSAALFTLAAELPAAILARMLGIHIRLAVQWQQAASGDWAVYAADVSRRTTESR